MLRPLLVLVVAVSACSRATSSAEPPSYRGAAIDRVLASRVTPAFQSDVMVLGTSHLAGERERLTARHLEPLLATLERFAPTRIAIEALSADELALLAEREAHDPAAAELLDMFGRASVTAGRTMQQALGVDRVAAERHAATLLDPVNHPVGDDDRLAAVAHLLAGYDFNSAALQWSYLPAAVRSDTESLPADVHALLQRRLESANEIVTVAMALARRLGLQRLYAIDSQYEGVRTLSAPREALEELFSDPARGALQDQERRERAEGIREAAFEAGDLLPLYLHVNSEEHQLGDLTQWYWLFEQRHSSGLDRFRYAMWELRNLRQATHIIDVAASGEPERVLVLVGSAHKAYLDRVLATQLSVRLVQLSELVDGVHDDE